MLTCRDVTERASLYLDRELGWWRQLPFAMHLFLCRHCRQYIEQMTFTVGLLQKKLVERPDPEVERSLMQHFRHSRKSK